MSAPFWQWPGRVVVGILVGLIRVYQVTLGPLLGPVCRFEPSCSRYMIGALRNTASSGASRGGPGACCGVTPGTLEGMTRREE